MHDIYKILKADKTWLPFSVVNWKITTIKTQKLVDLNKKSIKNTTYNDFITYKKFHKKTY